MERKLKQFERCLKAVANRRRLMILTYIKRRREASVGDISDAIKLSIKATSKHLGVLANADILEREQRSVQMFYRLSSDIPEPVKGIIHLL